MYWKYTAIFITQIIYNKSVHKQCAIMRSSHRKILETSFASEIKSTSFEFDCTAVLEVDDVRDSSFGFGCRPVLRAKISRLAIPRSARACSPVHGARR